MQKVDPFIPISYPVEPKSSPSRTPQLVRKDKRPPGTVDGIIRNHPARPIAVARSSERASQAKEEMLSAPSVPQQRMANRGRRGGKIKKGAIVVGVLLAGIAMQAVTIGEALIAVYAIYTIVRPVASRITFTLVLISLVTIVLLRLLGREVLAANFAVYSLLFAFVGVISLAREVRQARG